MTRLSIIAALLLAGCATTPRPVENDQTRAAMAYAERVMGRPAPVRVEWHLRPANRESNGKWFRGDTGGITQLFPDHSRIVIYVGPQGQQHQDIYNHEAGHAVDRQPGHDPKWKRYFYNWVDP
jgi:hypothetical protein